MTLSRRRVCSRQGCSPASLPTPTSTPPHARAGPCERGSHVAQPAPRTPSFRLRSLRCVRRATNSAKVTMRQPRPFPQHRGSVLLAAFCAPSRNVSGPLIGGVDLAALSHLPMLPPQRRRTSRACRLTLPAPWPVGWAGWEGGGRRSLPGSTRSDGRPAPSPTPSSCAAP